MFGVPDDHERGESDVQTGPSSVRIYYNQTDPFLLRDGVDTISVTKTEEYYRIDYSGFVTRNMKISHEGVAALGQHLLSKQSDPPHWIVDRESLTTDTLPWWIPDAVDLDPHLECQRCNTGPPATAVITPNADEINSPSDVFCEDCWENVSSTR